METRERVLGAEYPDMLTTVNNLAWSDNCIYIGRHVFISIEVYETWSV